MNNSNFSAQELIEARLTTANPTLLALVDEKLKELKEKEKNKKFDKVKFVSENEISNFIKYDDKLQIYDISIDKYIHFHQHIGENISDEEFKIIIKNIYYYTDYFISKLEIISAKCGEPNEKFRLNHLIKKLSEQLIILDAI